jgi:hypothetical protein
MFRVQKIELWYHFGCNLFQTNRQSYYYERAGYRVQKEEKKNVNNVVVINIKIKFFKENFI